MAIASALQRIGKDVFVPLFAAHSRVDLIAVECNGTIRLQCKSARVMNGSLYFHTCSHTGNVPVDYRDQIDAFAVYSPELDRVYLVPVRDAPVRGCTLRLDAPRNGQLTGIRWAFDYEVGSP
jgi:hypothetical protein